MRFKCLGCEVLARVLYMYAAQSPHIIDIEMLPHGLHEHSANLRARLQEKIDAINSPPYDAVLLAYGLCGQAVAGLSALSIPLVIPRAHDCITLFLGSRERYLEQFREQPGTYWYTQDYLERNDTAGSSLSLGSGSEKENDAMYRANVEKYGQDNADYLWEVMGNWRNHYHRAVYIDLGIGDGAAIEAKAQSEAAQRGWTFERLTGDLALIRRLLFGEWDSDFLQVPPGQSIIATYNDCILSCGKIDPNEHHN